MTKAEFALKLDQFYSLRSSDPSTFSSRRETMEKDLLGYLVQNNPQLILAQKSGYSSTTINGLAKQILDESYAQWGKESERSTAVPGTKESITSVSGFKDLARILSGQHSPIELPRSSNKGLYPVIDTVKGPRQGPYRPKNLNSAGWFPQKSRPIDSSEILFGDIGHIYYDVPSAKNLSEQDKQRLAFMMSDKKNFSSINSKYFQGKFHSYEEMMDPRNGVVIPVSMSGYTSLPNGDFSPETRAKKEMNIAASREGVIWTKDQYENRVRELKGEPSKDSVSEVMGQYFHLVSASAVDAVNSHKASYDDPQKLLKALETNYGLPLTMDKEEVLNFYCKGTSYDPNVVQPQTAAEKKALADRRNQLYVSLLKPALERNLRVVGEDGKSYSGRMAQKEWVKNYSKSIMGWLTNGGMSRSQAAKAHLEAERTLGVALPSGAKVAGRVDLYSPDIHAHADIKTGNEHAEYVPTQSGYNEAANLYRKKDVLSSSLLFLPTNGKDPHTVKLHALGGKGVLENYNKYANKYEEQDSVSSQISLSPLSFYAHHAQGFSKIKFVRAPYYTFDKMKGYGVLSDSAMQVQLGDGTIVPLKEFNDIFSSLLGPAKNYSHPANQNFNSLQSSVLKALGEETGAIYTVVTSHGSAADNGIPAGSRYLAVFDPAKGGETREQYDQRMEKLDVLDSFNQRYIDLLETRRNRSAYYDLQKKWDPLTGKISYTKNYKKSLELLSPDLLKESFGDSATNRQPTLSVSLGRIQKQYGEFARFNPDAGNVTESNERGQGAEYDTRAMQISYNNRVRQGMARLRDLFTSENGLGFKTGDNGKIALPPLDYEEIKSKDKLGNDITHFEYSSSTWDLLSRLMNYGQDISALAKETRGLMVPTAAESAAGVVPTDAEQEFDLLFGGVSEEARGLAKQSSDDYAKLYYQTLAGAFGYRLGYSSSRDKRSLLSDLARDMSFAPVFESMAAQAGYKSVSSWLKETVSPADISILYDRYLESKELEKVYSEAASRYSDADEGKKVALGLQAVAALQMRAGGDTRDIFISKIAEELPKGSSEFGITSPFSAEDAKALSEGETQTTGDQNYLVERDLSPAMMRVRALGEFDDGLDDDDLKFFGSELKDSYDDILKENTVTDKNKMTPISQGRTEPGLFGGDAALERNLEWLSQSQALIKSAYQDLDNGDATARERLAALYKGTKAVLANIDNIVRAGDGYPSLQKENYDKGVKVALSEHGVSLTDITSWTKLFAGENKLDDTSFRRFSGYQFEGIQAGNGGAPDFAHIPVIKRARKPRTKIAAPQNKKLRHIIGWETINGKIQPIYRFTSEKYSQGSEFAVGSYARKMGLLPQQEFLINTLGATDKQISALSQQYEKYAQQYYNGQYFFPTLSSEEKSPKLSYDFWNLGGAEEGAFPMSAARQKGGVNKMADENHDYLSDLSDRVFEEALLSSGGSYPQRDSIDAIYKKRIETLRAGMTPLTENERRHVERQIAQIEREHQQVLSNLTPESLSERQSRMQYEKEYGWIANVTPSSADIPLSDLEGMSQAPSVADPYRSRILESAPSADSAFWSSLNKDRSLGGLSKYEKEALSPFLADREARASSAARTSNWSEIAANEIKINTQSVTISQPMAVYINGKEIGSGGSGRGGRNRGGTSSSETDEDDIKLTTDQRGALREYRSIIGDQSSLRNEYLDIQKMLATDRRVNTDYRTRKSYQDRAAEIKELMSGKTADAALWEQQYGEDIKTNPLMKEAVSQIIENSNFSNDRKDAQRLTKESGAATLLQNLKTSFHGLLNQFTQFGLAYKVLGMVQTGIQNIVTAATNLDKAMTNIRIVTGDSREEAVKYMKSLSGLAGQLSVTTQETAQASNEWLRQGYSISDTNALITDSIHLSVLGMISAQEATSDLTSIMKGFHLSVNEAATAVDKLTAVDMESASSAGGIAQALQQVANVADTAGVSLDQTIGMISTISDVTQREPSSVGQALRTMIARFSNVKAGVYGTMNVDSDNAEATENVNDIEKVLKKVGIQVRSSELDFRSFSDVLSDVADKWDTLDDVSKKAIATSVAGVRQSEQFYALMNNWDNYQKLTEVSANSAGTAEKKYLSYTEQLEAAQKRLQAAWESLAQNVDLNKFLTGLDNFFADAVKNLPIVLRYVLRFFATMQAYKIPSLLGNAKSFLFDAGGLIGGRGQRVRNYLGGSHGYDAQLQESKVGTIGGGLFDKTPTGQLIKALKENTAAQQGNTTATQQNTSVKNEGSLTAGLPQEPYNMSAPAGSKWDPALNNGKGGYRDIATGRMVPGQYDYAKAGYITNPEDALTDSGYIFVGDTKTGVGKYVTQKEDGSFVGVGPDAKTVEMSLKDKMQYERRVNKQTKGNSAAIAATVASGIVSAALTAQTSGQWKSSALSSIGSSGEARDMSDDTQIASRAITGGLAAIGGVAGALVTKSPTGAAVGAQAGGGLGDLLMNWLGPILDKAANDRKDLVEVGEKGLTVMSNIKSSVSTLSDLSTESIDSSNYGKIISAKNTILQQLLSDDSDEVRDVFEKYLEQEGLFGGESGNGTLSDVLNEYANGDTKTRQKIATALFVAQNLTSANEYVKSQAETLDTLKDNSEKQTLSDSWATNNVGTAASANSYAGWGQQTKLAQMYIDAAEKAGVADKLKLGESQSGYDVFTNIVFWWQHSHSTTVDTSGMSTNERLSFYKDILEQAQEEGNSDLIDSVSDVISNLEAIKEKQEGIYDEVNEQNANSAVLSAQNSAGTGLTSMTMGQLKLLGPDAIREMVAEELSASGGLAGHDIWTNGEGSALTAYAKNIIDTSLKQYSSIYGVITGESYKLSEVLSLPESETKLELKTEFASAIGTTIDKLSAYADKYGDLTLGDFLLTPADLRTNLESYAKILNEIGSATGLTNETMESIISKYPDLIEYLGDTATLTSKLLGKMGQTSDLYSSGTMSSILGSSSVFDTLVSAIKAMGTGAGSLYDAVESDKVFGNASSLSDILTWLGSGSDLAKRVQEVINKVLNFNVDVKEDQTILNDVISYQTKMMDKQITNLNDQKEALSKINSQREYGNKLIEAQLKLENAQKEKKLVYREGVGFTYESDQAAIKEAQDALDELDVTKQQDLLQTEIDQLTSEKELLSDLANDSELKNLKEIYESWAKSNGVINTDQAKILTTITQLYNNFASLNVASAVSSGASTSATSASAAKEKMDTAWKNYQANSTSANLQAWQEAAKAYMNSGSGYSEDNMSEEQRTAYEKAIYSGKTYTFTDHDGKRHIATSTDPLLDSSDDGSNALKYAQSHDDVFVYSSAHKNGRSVSQLYSENYDSLSALLGALYKEEDGPLLLYADGKYIAYTGEQVLSTKVSDATGDTSSQFVYKAAALGSYGLPGGQTLLNEKGTEAIVTPYGTLTSLPSGTGVVPADLTQKLYDLSMVSPSILNALGAYKTGAGVAVSGIGGSSTDESLNINSLTMNVTAGSDFDADAFAEQLKQQAALTKRNH